MGESCQVADPEIVDWLAGWLHELWYREIWEDKAARLNDDRVEAPSGI